jgi:hypothetical protein
VALGDVHNNAALRARNRRKCGIPATGCDDLTGKDSNILE